MEQGTMDVFGVKTSFLIGCTVPSRYIGKFRSEPVKFDLHAASL